jgi:hypothetical protein
MGRHLQLQLAVTNEAERIVLNTQHGPIRACPDGVLPTAATSDLKSWTISSKDRPAFEMMSSNDLEPSQNSEFGRLRQYRR